MKLNRNDRCYCGSGKKYKQCHMQEDMAQEKAQKEQEAAELAAKRLVPPTRAEFVPLPRFEDDDDDESTEEIESENDDFDRLYTQFEDANYAEKQAILRSAIEEKSLDNELAFEFFNDLYPKMIERGEREKFAELVALLQTNLPEVYLHENQWFWSWQINNALALGDEVALQQGVNQLIAHGGQDLDQFFPMFDCLSYYDCRKVLLNALANHQLQIVPGKYFGRVEDEANQKFADLLVLDYIETHPQNKLLDENNFELLCQSLARYSPRLLRDRLAEFISWAGGISSRQWTMNDFQFSAYSKRQDRFSDDDDDDDDDDEKQPVNDPAIDHLRNLGYEFLHYARSTEGVALTKADLAREHLVKYILARHRDELSDDTRSNRPPGKNRNAKGKPKTAGEKPQILLPDHKTLDRYLIRFYGFMANGTYEGAALFELIPAWTRFLQAKGLVTDEEGHQALRSLQALSQSMLQIMENNDVDPALAVNMRKWRENAGT